MSTSEPLDPDDFLPSYEGKSRSSAPMPRRARIVFEHAFEEVTEKSAGRYGNVEQLVKVDLVGDVGIGYETKEKESGPRT